MSAISSSEGRSVRDRTLSRARGTSDSGSPGSSKTRASSIADESGEPRTVRSHDPGDEAMTPSLYSPLRRLPHLGSHPARVVTSTGKSPRASHVDSEHSPLGVLRCYTLTCDAIRHSLSSFNSQDFY